MKWTPRFRKPPRERVIALSMTPDSMGFLEEISDDAEFTMAKWVRARFARDWMRLKRGDIEPPAPVGEYTILRVRHIFTMRVSPLEHERMKEVAVSRGVSLSKALRDEVSREHALLSERQSKQRERR